MTIGSACGIYGTRTSIAMRKGLRTGTSREEFDEAAAILFRSLVLRKIGRLETRVPPDGAYQREPLSFLRLEVAAPRSPILVNRELAGGYWDDSLDVIEKGDVDLRFLQFFDWDNLGFREFAYYRVRIVASHRHARVVGKDALVEVGPAIQVLHEQSGTAGFRAPTG